MTIKDVAVRAGVSVSTVSRVLNDRPDVSDEVRKKVLSVVEELHYVPNNSARDITRQKSHSIGVIERGAGNPFFSSVINAMEEELENTKYSLVLEQIKAEDDELMAGASLVRSKRLQGLILLGGRFDYTPEQVELLEAPFVCCTFTNRFGTMEKENYSSVSINDRAEAKKATQYLLSHGHKKIAILLDSKEDHSIGELRYNGYCEALREAGIEPDPELVEEIRYYDMDAAYEGTKRLIRRRPDLTAIFSIADTLAIAAMKALSDEGKNVPEDVSVIAIDGIDISRYTIPTLTTLIQPAKEIGKMTIKAILNKIEGKEEVSHLRFNTELRSGGTVRNL